MQNAESTEIHYSGEWTIPNFSALALQKVSTYNPADFTIAASGHGLSPEDLSKAANATLNNYTSFFGKTVAPIALSNENLPEKSQNLRETLSGSMVSASPAPAGYVGISPVFATDTEKLAAYGFRVLPTGQTMMYAYIVSVDTDDAGYAAAAKGLNEWMSIGNETTNVAGASIVSRAAGVSSLSEPGWISSGQMVKDYGTLGTVQIYSDWYWDSVEQNRDQDQFYTTSKIVMTPGKITHGNTYRNHRFTLTIDPGYSSLSGNALHLPGAFGNSPTPTGTSGGQSITWFLSSSSAGLSWTNEVPDVSVVYNEPGDEISKWDGTFNRGGNQAEQMFSFKAGLRIVSLQPESRNGNTYILSKNTVDAYGAFFDGLFSLGPATERYLPQELYIRWTGAL